MVVVAKDDLGELPQREHGGRGREELLRFREFRGGGDCLLETLRRGVITRTYQIRLRAGSPPGSRQS